MTASLFHHPQYQALLSFLQRAKGPLLLHISDTHTESYPLAEELIQAVHPALILHTGDMADEWKAGRLTEHVADYKRHVLKLLNILKAAHAETWIVPEILSSVLMKARSSGLMVTVAWNLSPGWTFSYRDAFAIRTPFRF